MSSRRPVRILRLTPSTMFVSAASFEEAFMRHQAGAFVTASAESKRWIGDVLRGGGLPTDEQASRFVAATDGVDFLFPGYDLASALPLLVELRNRSRSGVRFLVRAHSPALCPLEWALLCALIMPGDVILCPSTSARALLTYLAPPLEGNLVVSPAPVGALPSPRSRDARPGRPIRLVTLGRVMPAKLLHRVIDGVASLPPSLRLRIRLWMAGPLTDNGGRRLPYATSLAARARRLGIADGIRLPGLVQGDEAKARFLGAADLLVNLSVSAEESFGMAIVEALSVGTPVVVTRWDGLPETAGPAGVAVPVTLRGPLAACDTEPGDVAAGIEAAVGDPTLRARCHGQAARFEPARTAASLAAALHGALAARNLASADGVTREDLRERRAAPDRGLLARTAPLPELGWSEIFEASFSQRPRGGDLRRQLVEALLPPITRFMAGMTPPAGDGESEGRLITATSEMVAHWHNAVAGTTARPASRLKTFRSLTGRGAAVRFLEIERARAAGEHTLAADLACQSIDRLLADAGAEHAVRALRQLAVVCGAAAREGDAIARLSTWLSVFPDEPATPAVWLLLSQLAARAASAASSPGSRRRLLGVARGALASASSFLGDDDPALIPIAEHVLALTVDDGGPAGETAPKPGRHTA